MSQSVIGWRVDGGPGVSSSPPLLSVEHLTVHFPVKKGVVVDREVGRVRAVDDVSFTLGQQETLGVVGESGCGKSTLAKCLLKLVAPTDGTVSFRGQDISKMSRRDVSALRRDVQMVFQDPQASLNPRKRVIDILGVALRLRGVHRSGLNTEARDLLSQVGLDRDHINRFPHEFSGGQRQRIGIARAVAVRPSLIVLDEPVSALDVSVQAQVINLLSDLQEDLRLAYLYIAHNLAVVRHVSDRVAVMYLGKIVESASVDELYESPRHPYSAALLSSIPVPELKAKSGRRAIASGEPPNPLQPPTGCRFNPRCPRAADVCREVEPPLTVYPGGHLVACHRPINVSAAALAGARRSDLSPLTAGSTEPVIE
jgi:oligopeptide/dipeptide ABC transporter ATP-binding protein